MKKILNIYFKSLDEFEKEFTKAMDKRQKLIQPQNYLYFDSVESFRNFMSIQKLELLTVIACQKPISIYELAKLLDRDFAQVQRDCVGLEGNGFIKLIESKNGRHQKKPVLAFNYNAIIIHLPKRSAYQIEFKTAA